VNSSPPPELTELTVFSSPATATPLAAIALGSNLSNHLGGPLAILTAVLGELHRPPHWQLQAVSRWYQTPAVGPPQPDYLNGCAVLAVTLPPETLLRQLLAIEQQFGRERRERWGPRTLDLDLLLYDQNVLTTPTLELPHPRMRERAFVLVPLAEVAPNWVEPVSGLTIRELAMAVDCKGIHPIPASGRPV
jgi:2-amino-4-hydroxy-6-hydroxymethyldihydropteridine diphosphokinase